MAGILMPFLDSNDVEVRTVGASDWELLKTKIYRGRKDTFTILAGFVTDLASSPRILSWLIPRSGRWTPAAVLHDYLWRVAIALGLTSPADADGLFRRVLRELGVPPVKRWMMWAGVRWGALFRFGLRRSGFLRTAPAVLAISLPAAVLLVVPVAGILIGMLLYGVIEWVATGGKHWGTWST